jgi:hypothetical protein
MEHRFVVFDGGSEPRIFKVPLNRTARLVNEFPFKRVEVFEALKDAKKAALAIVDRAEEKARPNIGLFAARPARWNEEPRKSLSELTEDRVETFHV